MERRRDALFRHVVQRVQPDLGASGFTLYDRGTIGDYRWVEFVRPHRGTRPSLPGDQSLVLYHFADHQHVGARLQLRGPPGSISSSRLAEQLWEYLPGTMVTIDGRELPIALRDWLEAIVQTSSN
jgi:hypothetical protein